MALLDAVGCSLQVTGEFSATTVGVGGSITFVTTDVYVGGGAVRVVGGSTPSSADITFTALALVTARCFVRRMPLFASPSVEEHTFARLRPGVGGTEITLRQYDSGIRLYSGTTLLATHAHTDWGVGEWLAVTVAINDTSGTTNAWAVRSRTLKESGLYLENSGFNTAIVGTWDAFQVYSTSTAADDEAVVNQIIVDDAYSPDAYPPNFIVQTLRPNSDISNQWTPGIGATSNFGEINETPPSVSETVDSTGTGGLTDIYGVDDAYGPTASTAVSGVLVGMLARNTVGSVRTMTVALLDAANTVLLVTGNLTPSNTGYAYTRRALFSTTAITTRTALNAARLRIFANSSATGTILVAALWAVAVVDVLALVPDSNAGVETFTISNTLPVLADANTSVESTPAGGLINTFIVVDDGGTTATTLPALTNTFTVPDANTSDSAIPALGVTVTVTVDASQSASDLIAITNTFMLPDDSTGDDTLVIANDLGVLVDTNESEVAALAREIFVRRGAEGPDVIFENGRVRVKIGDPDLYV